MSTFKSLLHAKCNAEVRIGLCFVFLTLLMVTAPAVNPLQSAQAAIDDAMPASFPKEVVDDWKDQDKVSGSSYDAAITKIVGSLPSEYKEKYEAGKGSYSGEKLYLFAHHLKRVSRMKPHESDLENVMCMRHHNFGGFVVGYHDNTDAGTTDDGWTAKGAMCLLEMKTYYPTLKEILKKTDAVVRDPCISFDGKKVLFAMSGPSKGSGYKIYEMEIANPSSIKQLTTDPGVGKDVADFEPCYLPNGDIMFTSTRCFGFVDCATHPVTNMFLMAGDGKHIRQVGFDQVNTFYPVLTDNGEVMYTRWEYNDRDLTNSMGIFTMNPDGCRQTEWFGNQISWPMTFIHARPIQGEPSKVVAIASGHHAPYSGELIIVDRMAGTNTNDPKAVKVICPVRPTKPTANKGDLAAGGVKFLFQNPYGLDDNSILVSWRKSESGNYRLFLMDTTGSRELLAWGEQSISQPVIVKARKAPPMIAKQANYSETTGEYTLQNVYYGPGMEGVEKGKAKTLRVVKLYYRVQNGSIGTNMPSGPSGAFVPAIFCPIALNAGSWEAKEVLGETKIWEDGSASFKAPARAPVYFQILDEKGLLIASMRSWSTLMPGEKFPCFGCHENKLESPPGTGNIPMAGDPKPLEKPLGIEDKPFDYPTMVQPIFDRHCVSCHKGSHASGFDLTGSLVSASSKKWATSYRSLIKGIGPASSNKAINISYVFATPEQKKPYSFGSSQSGIMTKVLYGESHKDKIKTDITDKEKRIIACWIDLAAPHSGNYAKYMSSSDSTRYMNLVKKKLKWQEIEDKTLKELAAVSVLPDNNGAINIERVAAVKQLSLGYIPAQRALVLNNPGQGSLLLIDLMGNVVSRVKISDQISSSSVSISLPASLSTGCYLARFEGVNGIQQAKFTFAK